MADLKTFLLISFIFGAINVSRARNVQFEWDPKGYIMYCPCSGRFSNQVNTLLGSLYFAKTLDRVLVIPPFIKYSVQQSQATNLQYIPFDDLYELDILRKYHPDVITMRDFMDHLAPLHWPPEERKAYCAMKLAKNNDGKCQREGNPHGTFWEAHNIEFVNSDIWEDHLYYNVDYDPWRKLWIENYPPEEHPVIALMNAPAYSPISPKAQELQQYLQWTPAISDQGDKFIAENIEKPFIGIHLRNGADWSRTCDLADGSHPRLLSAHQCYGQHSDDGPTHEVCIQSEEMVVEELRKYVKKYDPKTIFVATDHVSMEEEIQDAFPSINVVTMNPDQAQVDLHILEQADRFIGNCVSAFSFYVNRARQARGQKSNFFNFNPFKHDEL